MRSMTSFLSFGRFLRGALLALPLVACSATGSPSADAGSGACGDLVCAVNEYCIQRCESSGFVCQAFTRSCDPAQMCACPEVAELGGLCDATARRIEVGCP